jgi:hypothetical protein
MKQIHIKQKLEQMGVTIDSIKMGDFDQIGEFTAKRQRTPDDVNYHKYGAYYRSNFERGILIYYLIRQYNLTSMLEIGFGRGYSTLCAARAFYDAGVDGKIISIEPNPDEKFINALTQIFPKEWFKSIQMLKGSSKEILPHLSKEKFDLVYIDGDHSFEGTKHDWEGTKDLYNKFMLFDDYHLPSKNDPGIKCSQLIDTINEENEGCLEKELIILDRRMFFDDRQIPDNEINYGQVLLTKKGVARDDW